MKKIVVCIMLILVLMTLTSCDNYRQYPSDSATRYPTLEQALEIDKSQIEYYFEEGNIVYVSYSTGGGGKTLYLFKDNGGYVSSSEFYEHYWYKNILGDNGEAYLLGRAHYADKYVITLGIIGTDLDYETEFSDSIGSEFQYKYHLLDSSGQTYKISTYFLVLDEIPKDYKMYINSVPYTISQLKNNDLVMILVFGVIIAIPLAIIIVLTIRKAKKQRHKQKMDAIWRAKQNH